MKQTYGQHPSIEPIQALRGLAALSVAFLHTAQEAQLLDPTGTWQPRVLLLPWAAGVDVFFVISGLVMVYSSADLFGTAGGARRFLLRRVARIVPLYWVLTSLAIAAGLVTPGALSGDTRDPQYLAASYLFLPYERPDGFIQPVLRVGWTLNYEIAFYAVFGAFLSRLRRSAIAGVLAAICGIAAIGATLHPAPIALRFWTDPIMLEFACGVSLGALLLERVRLPFGVRAGLLASALALGLVSGEIADTPGQHALLACCAVAGAAMGPPGLLRSWTAK